MCAPNFESRPNLYVYTNTNLFASMYRHLHAAALLGKELCFQHKSGSEENLMTF